MPARSLRAHLLRMLLPPIAALLALGAVVAYYPSSEPTTEAYDTAVVDIGIALGAHIQSASSEYRFELPAAVEQVLRTDRHDLIFYRVLSPSGTHLAGDLNLPLPAGETQAAFLSTTTIAGQAKAGKVRPLAVLREKRFSAAPDIPSSVEAGFPGLDSDVWFGLFAPAKTPRAIVMKINKEVVAAMQAQEARTALLAQGAEAVPGTPEEFDAHVKREIAKWGKVIKAAGIQPQ